MSYWGCGSRRNQALWLLVVWCGATGLCLLGTALGLDLGCNLYWDYEHRDCYMSHNYYYSYAYYNVCAQSGSVRFLAAGSVLIGAGLAGLIATRLAHAHCHDPVDRDPAAAAGSPYGAAPTQAAGPAASDSSVGDTDTGTGTGTGAEEQARSSLPGPAAHAGVQPAEAGHRCCHGGRCTWRAVRPSEGLAWFASGACILAGSCLLCLGGAERACLDDYPDSEQGLDDIFRLALAVIGAVQGIFGLLLLTSFLTCSQPPGSNPEPPWLEPTYWGCRSRPNQWAWAFTSVLGAAGAACFITLGALAGPGEMQDTSQDWERRLLIAGSGLLGLALLYCITYFGCFSYPRPGVATEGRYCICCCGDVASPGPAEGQGLQLEPGMGSGRRAGSGRAGPIRADKRWQVWYWGCRTRGNITAWVMLGIMVLPCAVAVGLFPTLGILLAPALVVVVVSYVLVYVGCCSMARPGVPTEGRRCMCCCGDVIAVPVRPAHGTGAEQLPVRPAASPAADGSKAGEEKYERPPPCYWGCRTRANRVAWAIVAVLGVVGAAAVCSFWWTTGWLVVLGSVLMGLGFLIMLPYFVGCSRPRPGVLTAGRCCVCCCGDAVLLEVVPGFADSAAVGSVGALTGGAGGVEEESLGVGAGAMAREAVAPVAQMDMQREGD